MREMKDSGIEWIGEIPETWEIRPGKYLFEQRNTRGNRVNLELLSPTQQFGVISQKEYEKLTGMKAVKLKENVDLSQLKTIHKGDYCISLRSFQGGFEYSENEGVVSPAYQVFYAKVPTNRIYYKYLFKTDAFISKMNAFTMSLRDGKNIAFSDFGKTLIPVPSLSEQQAIADFLDAKCAEIEGLSAAIEAQIETLRAYKKSLITRAVTKGLDPDAEMKDSGVEWIGNIPKDWIYPKITYLLNTEHVYPIGDGDHGTIKANDYVEEGIPFIRVQNLGFSSSLQLDNVVYITKGQNRTIQNSTLRPGDILFAKTGATIGKVGIVPQELPISNTTSHVGKITVNPKAVIPKFLFYAFSSTVVYKMLWDIANQKSTRPELSIEEIKGLHIIIPKSISEQQAIADFLDAKCAEIEAVISEKETQRETLSAYRKSLIYTYVTGKREVPCHE